MTGAELYEVKIAERIEGFIGKHADLYFLRDFANYLAVGRSNNTVYLYITKAAAFVEWTKKNPEEIGLMDYLGYMREFSLKTSTYQIDIYSALRQLSTFFTLCNLPGSREKISPEDYMKTVKRPKAFESAETIKKRSNNYLTEYEVHEYLDCIRNYDVTAMIKAGLPDWRNRDLLIVSLFLTTGIRCAALHKLDENSIDIEQRVLIAQDKGGKTRTYQIPGELIMLVKKWKVQRYLILKKKSRLVEKALFINQYGERLAEGGISEVTQKYGEYICDKRITPHKLRATFATLLYEKTGDVYLVQDMMNHSSANVTKRYIRGREAKNAKKTMQVMSQIITAV